MLFGHRVLVLFIVVLMGAADAHAAGAGNDKLIEAGRDIAQTFCARCHGVGRVDDSPLEQAPPFRRLRERYPIENLAESFAEGIVVGHTDMPTFEFEPHQIKALLAYLDTLDRGKRP